MEYTVVIRTLGKAGEKYQRELDSLCRQTIPPKEIIVFLAEGYEEPVETCGRERIVRVRKGMVAQRALRYDEVTTDYMLFLDDDVYLPEDGVERLYKSMVQHGADVISPNTFENHRMGHMAMLLNALLGKAVPFKSEEWAYRVLKGGGFGFNINPTKDFYWSESNAGPCFLCKKSDFLSIHFDDDLWLDETPYAVPEDQVMFYKMHLAGLKVGTLFGSGIIHLDAGTSVANTSERQAKILYSEVRNQIIFWHKYIKPYNSGLNGFVARLGLTRYIMMRRLFALKSFLRGNDMGINMIQKAVDEAKLYK